MAEDWSREEVELIVADYMELLLAEFRGEYANKAAHNRALQALLPLRSKGSIEFKHSNISAILVESGFPYVDGYKPLGNYQGLLREVVLDRLGEKSIVALTAQAAVARPAASVPFNGSLTDLEVPPPIPTMRRLKVAEEIVASAPQIPCTIDYVERESRNRSLGLAGEELVLGFEKHRLLAANRRDLAERIEHTSKAIGDHMGFDITSFETSGAPRLIEVKTTRYAALTPFFVSRNEVKVSMTRPQHFHLYRVHRFEVEPRLFVLRGSLSSNCELDPVQYSARIY